MASLRYGTDEVWAKCESNGIDPDGGWIRFRVWPNKRLSLYDSKAGVGGSDRAFVLFSPDLPNRIINRLLTVRKEKKVPSGFCSEHALDYDNVYVIARPGDFSDEALLPLVQAGVNVIRVPDPPVEQLTDDVVDEIKAQLEGFLT
jgi:hypothetical protein